MKKGLVLVIGFISGALIGSGVTYFLTEKTLNDKYSKIAEDEIQSTKDALAREKKELFDKNEKAKERIAQLIDDNKFLYANTVDELGYGDNETTFDKDENGQLVSNATSDFAEYLNDNLPGVPEPTVKPYSELIKEESEKDIYLITDEQFGELDDYDVNDYTLYSDGTVTDNTGGIVQDPSALFGESIYYILQKEIDDGETMSQFVRNTIRKADYQIELVDAPFYEE